MGQISHLVNKVHFLDIYVFINEYEVKKLHFINKQHARLEYNFAQALLFFIIIHSSSRARGLLHNPRMQSQQLQSGKGGRLYC